MEKNFNKEEIIEKIKNFVDEKLNIQGGKLHFNYCEYSNRIHDIEYIESFEGNHYFLCEFRGEYKGRSFKKYELVMYHTRYNKVYFKNFYDWNKDHEFYNEYNHLFKNFDKSSEWVKKMNEKNSDTVYYLMRNVSWL